MEVIDSPNPNWNRPANIPEFKVDPILVLILSILTCGLYLIYWNVKVAEVFNAGTYFQVLLILVKIRQIIHSTL